MTPATAPLVVGIDGCERSLDALALAARLADPGRHVLLIHVRRDGRSSNLTALQAAGSAVAHHVDPAAPAITQPDPAGVRSLDARRAV
jgi:hypothetical protein